MSRFFPMECGDQGLAFDPGAEPNTVCYLYANANLSDIEGFAGQSLSAGDIIHKNRLELRVLPFVSQANYDRLLWSCDINLVRGETRSCVHSGLKNRCSGRSIHNRKVPICSSSWTPFLDLFLAGLSQSVAEPIRRFIVPGMGKTRATFTRAVVMLDEESSRYS